MNDIGEIRLIIRCVKEPRKHAKILRFEPGFGMGHVEALGELLDGTSAHYIHKPGPDSPIGKCAICGGELNCEIQDWRQGGHA